MLTRKSVIVPSTIFDKTKLKELASANFPIAGTEEIQFNKLKSVSACNVFVIPSYITTLMVNTFPEINFYHQATPYIENLIQNTSEDLKLSANFYYDFIDIAITEQGKLLFYNTFSYRTPTDALYSIGAVMAQLKLEKTTPVLISGYVDKNSDYFKLLSKYLPNVNIAEIDAKITYPFKEVPEHTFLNMITLPLCV